MKKLNLTRAVLPTLTVTMLAGMVFSKAGIKTSCSIGACSLIKSARILPDEKPKDKSGNVYDDPFKRC